VARVGSGAARVERADEGLDIREVEDPLGGGEVGDRILGDEPPDEGLDIGEVEDAEGLGEVGGVAAERAGGVATKTPMVPLARKAAKATWFASLMSTTPFITWTPVVPPKSNPNGIGPRSVWAVSPLPTMRTRLSGPPVPSPTKRAVDPALSSTRKATRPPELTTGGKLARFELTMPICPPSAIVARGSPGSSLRVTCQTESPARRALNATAPSGAIAVELTKALNCPPVSATVSRRYPPVPSGLSRTMRRLGPESGRVLATNCLEAFISGLRMKSTSSSMSSVESRMSCWRLPLSNRSSTMPCPARPIAARYPIAASGATPARLSTPTRPRSYRSTRSPSLSKTLAPPGPKVPSSTAMSPSRVSTVTLQIGSGEVPTRARRPNPVFP
jgi:hypothetical protein